MARKKKNNPRTVVEAIRHESARRSNIPTAEYQAILTDQEKKPIRAAYGRRNRDLDPQLVWRGKDEQNTADLIVQAPPLYIQEKVHSKVLIDDLLRQSEQRHAGKTQATVDMFADFNGLPDSAAKTEFYQHDANWSNRMILGDSLQVMASLAEREGLRGKVQCIYIDPPYGIKFNSNFQWSTTSRDVKDGNAAHITREPEQVKAFRDTWRDGVHSYLAYLRDRLTIARELLTQSGSVFVQIGDENVHRVRVLMDEVFGEDNFVRQIVFAKTGSMVSNMLGRTSDYLLWYAKDCERAKYRTLFAPKEPDNFYKMVEMPDGSLETLASEQISDPQRYFPNSRVFQLVSLESAGSAGQDTPFEFEGTIYRPTRNRHWSLTWPDSMEALKKTGRIISSGNKIRWKYYIDDYPLKVMSEVWSDTSGFNRDQAYVVETRPKIVQRCILMTTDPGDLVLDPTCGSGTTAYVAEQWGRRWITIDTSRVALALARARIMGARYPWYLLADSPEGQLKEAEITRRVPSQAPTYGDIRQGFVYQRVPHITLKSIANNAEIDVIQEKWQETLEPLRARLNQSLGETWQEWEIPREAAEDWSTDTKTAHTAWWEARIARQREIDASIAAKADTEYLYDKPYEDKRRVRVSGPFTVESLAPHRMLAVDADGKPFSIQDGQKAGYGESPWFTDMVLDTLRMAGVQQTRKEDRITFTSLKPWPGRYVCAQGHYVEGAADTGATRRAGVFIGPEFGTVARADLVAAVREAADADFNVLVACAFNYDAHATEFDRLGRIPILKARMNADLHMAGDLKNTGKGNLFVIFGEPDIDILKQEDDNLRVRINGVDIFHPNSGEIRSHGADGIACWFVDTDYNEESFFVRHAYFLGASDPWKKLKTTLKAEIDPDAWATLKRDISRPFPRPASGRIAVKVINHLGDEAMRVFRI